MNIFIIICILIIFYSLTCYSNGPTNLSPTTLKIIEYKGYCVCTSGYMLNFTSYECGNCPEGSYSDNEYVVCR